MILLSLFGSRLLPEFREQIEAEADGRELLISIKPEEIEKSLDRIEIAMGDVSHALIPRMPNIKWLQLWSAGADFLQHFPALKEHPLIITSASGVHVHQMAEHFFAMLLGWSRGLPAVYEARHKHQWMRVKEQQLAGLNGKTLLILGYGNIGQSIARIAVAFGMQVTGLRQNISRSTAITGVKLEEASKLMSLLPSADYVLNLLPLTSETRHSFDAGKFAVMKKTALYINLGRGPTTDEDALIEALNSKTIAGALLDVTETEPLPETSALWDMDNVMITGHYAGLHPGYSRLAMDIALENLRRYKRGEALVNVVDKVKGY